ncbi:MAG: hypothetical protein LLG06_08085 [Desulfobacteraceae bacterium]|nr:hypothetical protein [Desulfobacteraceae bacterium]
MESISSIFGSNPSISSIFQICLDILILALLAGVFLFKKPKISKKDEEVIQSFDKIIEETGKIAQEFEANLTTRQEMLQHITTRLDQRIQEAQGMCSRLEQLVQINSERVAAPAAPPAPGPQPRGTDQQKVLLLAKKGLGAAEIARSMKRPVGEIELILNLQRISS